MSRSNATGRSTSLAPGEGDLLTALRDHDLPQTWDGHLVTWRGWHPLRQVFICPRPQPGHCEQCRSKKDPVTNVGTVALSPSTTRADIDADALNRRRLGPLAHKRPLLATIRLYVFRCPDCLLDQVLDITTDEFWTLDHTDYTDHGSTRPPHA